HDAGTGPLLHGLDLTTAGVDVADDLAHVVLGRGDLDGHHRLEEHGAGLARGLLEGLRTGDLERELGGVDLVVGTVEQRHADTGHLVAGEDAELHGLLRTGVDRRDVLLRHAATGHLVDELVRGVAALDRLDRDDDAGELAGTTRLLLVGELDLLDRLADGLAVRDLRLADVGLDLELTAHAVDQHLEVQLAHTADDGLAGLLVRVNLEGRVLLGQALDRDAELLLVALRLGLDGDLDDRGREVHGLQDHRVLVVGQRLTGGGLLQAHDGDDVTGAHRLDLLTLVGVHAVDLADALLLALHGVQHLGAGLQTAGVHADEGELAEVRVAHDLEREGGEGLVVRRLALDDLLRVLDVVALDGLDVERGGQVAHDRVEQGLHALVLERGAAEHGGDGGAAALAGREGDPTDGRVELLRGGLGALQVQLHQLFVVLRDGLGQLAAPLLGGLGVRGRDVDGVVHLALGRLGGPDEGLHRHEVDDTAEVGLGADRQLHDQRLRTQAVGDHVDAAVELGTGAVQLVHEADTR